jgi:prepilin-type N-terminal cleavage/methylation domain-containing protein
MKINRGGFTLIELIMTIVIMGIIVVASASSYRNLIERAFQSTDIVKAVNMARVESSVVNSISYSDATLSNGYNNLTSNYLSSGYDLRRQVSYQLPCLGLVFFNELRLIKCHFFI